MEHNFRISRLSIPCDEISIANFTRIASSTSLIMNFFLLIYANYEYKNNIPEMVLHPYELTYLSILSII